MMNWRRFTTLIISIILLVPFEQWVHACAGGDDPYDYFPSYFFSNVNKNAAYSPFYYTAMLTYADKEDGDDPNIEEWYQYTGKSVAKGDIDSFIYTLNTKDINVIANHISKGGPLNARAQVIENAFAKWMIAQKDKDAANYLLYAKQCEAYAMPEDGYYDQKTYEWKTVARDTKAMYKLQEDGRTQLATAKKEFIQLRYKYQLLRLAFYSRNYPGTLKLYEELIGKKEYTGLMYARCLELKAGAMYRLGNKIDAAYLYTRSFDLSDDRKPSSHISFSWATKGDIENILKQCKNDHERAVVYVMRGLHDYGDEMETGWNMMQAAYKADPNVKGLSEIMTREINKTEERYISPGSLYFTDSQVNELKKQYPAYLAKLQQFSQQVAKDSRTENKAFWQLASAYIYLIQDDYTNASKYLDIAANERMTLREKDVHGVTGMLLTLKQNKTIDAAVESKLLPSLQWVQQQAEKDHHFASVYNDMMTMLMTKAYLQQGDTVKAVYTMSGYQSWDLLDDMSVAQLEKVKAFIKKTGKTPYETWLIQNSSYQESMLYEMQGTKHMRAQEFDKAVDAFKKVSDSAIHSFVLPDCFVSHIQDMQDWNKSDSGVLYNKLTLAQKLAGMKKKLDENPTDAGTAYSYANAMYNLTYYGKGWQAVAYYRSGSDYAAYYVGDERAKTPYTKKSYYTAAIAEKYYMQAFSNAKDAELKARCLFMAAKCWQKNCPIAKGIDYYSENERILYYNNSLKNPYFKQLKEYGTTKFYRDATNTCSYLKDYVKK